MKFISVLLTFLFTMNLYAEEDNPSTLAIQGYSPVSYFTKNIAEKGSSTYQTTHKGKVYYLASAEQLKLFNGNPEKYIPRFEAFCPYSLALGKRVPIDPTNFKIVADTLLLFHKTEDIDGLALWNNADNEQELIERAMQEYLKIKF